MNKKTNIWVTFRKEGIHKYPAALDDPKLATGDEYDVSFLGYPHRHIFHFKVAISVTHNDRDIEFIQFKRWMEKLYSEKTLELDYLIEVHDENELKRAELFEDALIGVNNRNLKTFEVDLDNSVRLRNLFIKNNVFIGTIY